MGTRYSTATVPDMNDPSKMLELEPDLTNLMYSGATEATKDGSHPSISILPVNVRGSEYFINVILMETKLLVNYSMIISCLK